MFDFGKSFVNYKIETQKDTLTNAEEGNPVYISILEQSRYHQEEEWAIQSLLATLGLFGGLSGIVWGLLAICFEGYESFKFENSMIAAMYPTAPRDRTSDDNVATSEREAKHKMM